MNEELFVEQNIPAKSEEALFLEQYFSPDGVGTKLMTPITKLDICNDRIANAFKLFLDSVEVGETFTVMELLTTPEMVYGKSELIAKQGDAVYLLTEPVSDPRLQRSLLQTSAAGLCGLLQATRGVELDLPAGMTLAQLANKRMLILRERDGERFCKTNIVKMIRIGSLCPDRLRIKRGLEILADYPLSGLLPTEAVSLTVDGAEVDWFEQAFAGALGFACCAALPGEFFVNLPADLAQDAFLAGALGLFTAMMHYRFGLPAMRYASNGKSGLVVPRPQVNAGDCIYAFRPKYGGAENRPLPVELIKLQKYLMDSVRAGKIKSVLPLKKNASEMMQRLGGGDLEYVAERDFPTEGFAMLAILPGGADVPGTKMGSFVPKSVDVV